MLQVRRSGLPGGVHDCSSQADYAQLPGQSPAALCRVAVPCSTVKHRLCSLHIVYAQGRLLSAALLFYLHRTILATTLLVCLRQAGLHSHVCITSLHCTQTTIWLNTCLFAFLPQCLDWILSLSTTGRDNIPIALLPQTQLFCTIVPVCRSLRRYRVC